MNKKQKIVVTVCLVIIAAAFIVWLIHGGEIFTKTQVFVEKEDELFGTTYKELKDQFVLGLDYTLGISGLTAVAGGILFFIFKNKNNKKGNQ